MVLLYLAHVHEIRFLTVTSPSMEATFSSGDIIVTRSTATDSLQKNDIVVLPHPLNQDLLFSHRVTDLRRDAKRIVIQTKGDANPAPDDWTLEISSQSIPEVIGVLPTASIINLVGGRRELFLLLLTSSFALSLRGMWHWSRRRAFSTRRLQ